MTGLTYTRQNDEELRRLAQWIDRESASKNAANEFTGMLERIKNEMLEGVCHFTFTKVGGERREAYGTRLSNIIAKYSTPRTQKKPKNEQVYAGTFPYFDLVRRDWRCFRVDRLVDVDTDYGE